MNLEYLNQSHLRTVLLQRIVARLEMTVCNIREAENTMLTLVSTIFKTRDKPLTTETDSLLCRKTLTNVLGKYVQDARVSSRSTHKDLVESLYVSYGGSHLIDCMKLLLEERCTELTKKTNVESENSLPISPAMEQLTQKHVSHVREAARQAKLHCKLKDLAVKANNLQVQLEAKLDQVGKLDCSVLQTKLRRHQVKVELETMEHLVNTLQQRVNDRRAKLVEVDQMEHDVLSFRSELTRCEHLIERLRVDNRTLSLSLPAKQQQALELKTEMQQHLALTHRSLQDLVSTDPMQRLLPLLKHSASLTDWRLEGQGCSISCLPHNALCQNPFYNKCCALMGIPEHCRHPDVVLRRIATLALASWVSSEEAERLRDALLILEEESRTISMIQKRDVHMQMKARQRAKPYIDRINDTIEEIRSRLSHAQHFVEDWKELAVSLSRRKPPAPE